MFRSIARLPARTTVPAAAALIFAVTLPALAEEKPLWEFGIGAALINFPDYRGADQRTTYLLPYPYVVYRGDILKVDGDRIRGLFFESERLQLDVSASGSVPADSGDNEARRGMPDLDPTFEIGPALFVNLARARDRRWDLDLRLPFRLVYRTDLSYLHYTGWIFNPHLNYDLHGVWPAPGWNFGVSSGPLFAARRYHEYFYDVGAAFATPERPEFHAAGGYSGFRTTFALSKRFERYWVGAFIRYDALSGARFEDSPLVKSKNDVSAGIGVTWILKQSQRMVPVDSWHGEDRK